MPPPGPVAVPRPTRTRPKLSTSQIVMIVLGGMFAVSVFVATIWAMVRSSASRPGVSGELDEPLWIDTGPPSIDDHWHAAYGIWVCNGFEAPAQDGPSYARTGIHTHGDGLIHIHPTDTSYAGRNATLGLFAESIGLDVSRDALYLPDGTEKDECDGRPARVTVWRWDADDLDKPPEQLGHDLWTIRFAKDREVYVIALNPEGAPAPPLPRTVDWLPRNPNSTGTTRRPRITIPPPSPTPPTVPGTTVPSNPGTMTRRDSTGRIRGHAGIRPVGSVYSA